MTPSERIAAIRLSEKIRRNPKYAKKIGINISIRKTDNTRKREMKKLEN